MTFPRLHVHEQFLPAHDKMVTDICISFPEFQKWVRVEQPHDAARLAEALRVLAQALELGKAS